MKMQNLSFIRGLKSAQKRYSWICKSPLFSAWEAQA